MVCIYRNMVELKAESCPYASSNIFSKVTMWWMNAYFHKGFRKQIKFSDLHAIAEKDQSKHVTEKLSLNWEKECENAARKNKTPSFAIAFIKTFLWSFSFWGLALVISEFLRAIGPFFIGELTRYFVNPHEVPKWYPYMCATGLSVSSFLYITLDNYIIAVMQTLGWNAKTAVVGLMYKKTLRLSHYAFSKITTGRIVNLASTDALRYNLAFACTHFLWLAPLECAILAYMLYIQLGTSGLVGVFVLIFLMILQTVFGKVFGTLRLRIAARTDERVQLTNELISGMRIVKMYSWEKSFKETINMLRNKEMTNVLKASFLRSFNYTTNHSTSQILSFVTFLAFTVLNGNLNLQIVLVSLGLFTVLMLGAGLIFPFTVERFFETRAAMKRTQDFLLLPEMTFNNHKEKKSPKIEMIDFCASWNETGSNTLQDISIKVNPGTLLMVIGPVGAGKSSFLSSILGELPASSGKIQVNGNLVYSSQIPWLFSDTIRNNILFGERFDENRYLKVVKACALEQDFCALPCGDQSLVGERGVTLSGGQKARVGLARLAYRSDYDIAIMDDPLSAVDPSVADVLFEKCICDLMKDKIRILVTHQIQFMEKADYILILKEGRILDQGNFFELTKKGIDLASLMKEKNEDKSNEVYDNNEDSDVECFGSSKSLSAFANQDHYHRTTSMTSQESFKLTQEHDFDSLKNEENQEKESFINTNNPKSVSFKVYRDYFNSGVHLLFFIFLFIAIVVTHALVIMSDWWLAQWAIASQKFDDTHYITNASIADRGSDLLRNSSNTVPPLITTTSKPLFDNRPYLEVYAILTIVFFVLMYIRTAMHYYLCVRSSVGVHNKMLSSVLKAKIRFFDTNPIGAVLNRFSKDMNQVDESLPTVLLDVIFNAGAVLAIVIFVVFINYFVVIIVIPLVIYLVWIRRYFVSTSREIKRIEGEKRSPVYSHLSATLQGLITIRTFRMQDAFIEKNDQLQDEHGAAWTAYYFGNRWFAYRLDVITAAFISSCAFLSVILIDVLPDDWLINPGNLGLTLTYSTSLLIWFQWGVRQSAELENIMTSVERIQEYQKLPEEEKKDMVFKKLPDSWPSCGAIIFKNVSYSYYEGGPSVLKNINLSIKAKEKLGIVGRTGAGKSSIVATIFRMSDHISGSVIIDGVEANEVTLHDWRRTLTIIPQDPVLFSGTMRNNLDPFTQYTDEQLWNSLEKVQLKSVVESFPLKLQSVLNEHGSNLSVGQRQLVCLARALLRNNRILIIDEATANVDTRTDRLVQETIRKEFADCTVLTVAHRLDTVIDSDRILVLDEGNVLECDHAHVLLQNKSGTFSGMVKKTGRRELHLREAAKLAYIECQKRKGHQQSANEQSVSEIRNHIKTVPNSSESLSNVNERTVLI